MQAVIPKKEVHHFGVGGESFDNHKSSWRGGISVGGKEMTKNQNYHDELGRFHIL